MRRGPLVAVCCALLLVLAGCSGGANTAGSDGGGAAVDTGGEAAEATAAPDDGAGSADGDGTGGIAAQIEDREIIYEATVRLRVDDYDAASTRLTRLARERGGYVGSANSEVRGEGNETWTTGTVVLRIPSGNYSTAYDEVLAAGEVRSQQQSTEDVTAQVVDLEARLESLRAERDRLRELYDRANDTDDVLAVQRELSDVQTEIERTEARLQSVQRRVAYSTITVHLEEEPPDYVPPERTQWYETPLTEAFLDSVDGVIVLGRGLVVLTAYALPYLAVLSVPVAGAVFGIRWLRDRP
ncbi:DUF4349 domain-containing protein [Halobaculum lipolyticum]|uniref:DUF4349 domain-containing protein n=1 Tax=Halobaculum lipolyticum TaxID=3032001 RepID=A0ABD5WG45_9EURY|nr:DUF4349 domain-containing protein [Halobaculum sp. DT31]